MFYARVSETYSFRDGRGQFVEWYMGALMALRTPANFKTFFHRLLPQHDCKLLYFGPYYLSGKGHYILEAACTRINHKTVSYITKPFGYNI